MFHMALIRQMNIAHLSSLPTWCFDYLVLILLKAKSAFKDSELESSSPSVFLLIELLQQATIELNLQVVLLRLFRQMTLKT